MPTTFTGRGTGGPSRTPVSGRRSAAGDAAGRRIAGKGGSRGGGRGDEPVDRREDVLPEAEDGVHVGRGDAQQAQELRQGHDLVAVEHRGELPAAGAEADEPHAGRSPCMRGIRPPWAGGDLTPLWT